MSARAAVLDTMSYQEPHSSLTPEAHTAACVRLLDAFRAEVLREAADAICASEYLRGYTDDHMTDMEEAADFLRRMAEGGDG